MDRRMKRKVAAGAAALVAVAGGGAAIAATQLSPKQESQAVLNDAAGQLGPEDRQQADVLYQDYQAMMTEYRQLLSA